MAITARTTTMIDTLPVSVGIRKNSTAPSAQGTRAIFGYFVRYVQPMAPNRA